MPQFKLRRATRHYAKHWRGHLIHINALRPVEENLSVFKSGDIMKKASIMSQNIGAVDRTLRVIVGLILVCYAMPVSFPSTGWNWVGWIGVIPIATAFIGFCPAYKLVGVSTCKR